MSYLLRRGPGSSRIHMRHAPICAGKGLTVIPLCDTAVWVTQEGESSLTCEGNSQLSSQFYPQSKKGALASLQVEAEKDRVRDKMEGLDLFYLALALMGMRLRHSGETTQIV